MEQSAIVRPGTQTFVRDELKPILSLTEAWKQKFSLWTSPGTDLVRDKFDHYRLADKLYADEKDKQRAPENFLAPNAVLITPNPNNPAPESEGAAQIEQAP